MLQFHVAHLREAVAHASWRALPPPEGAGGARLLHAPSQNTHLVKGGLEVRPAHPEDAVVHGTEAHLCGNLGVLLPKVRVITPGALPGSPDLAIHEARLAVRVAQHHQLHWLATARGGKLPTDQRVRVAEDKPVWPVVAPLVLWRLELGDGGSHDVVPRIVLQQFPPHFLVVEGWRCIRHLRVALARTVTADVLCAAPVPLPEGRLCVLRRIDGRPHKAVDDREACEGYERIRLGTAGQFGVGSNELGHRLLQQQRPDLAAARTTEERHPLPRHLLQALVVVDVVILEGLVTFIVNSERHGRPVLLACARDVVVDLHNLPRGLAHVIEPQRVPTLEGVSVHEEVLHSARELRKSCHGSNEPAVSYPTLAEVIRLDAVPIQACLADIARR
mmetsp:Transcript_42206/g.109169  ORF Transcript_42206/g.109169 Transcript_42206/m.109169 type:complete len:389 (-) Transcript_42206:282-1448(-)